MTEKNVKQNDNNRRIGKKVLSVVLALIVIVIACGGAIVFGGWYTNGFESISGLYLKYNGSVVNGAVIELPESGQVAFEVKSAGFNKEVRNFSVQIIPNAEEDFNYIIGRDYYKFSNVEGLNEVFDIEVCDGYFTLESRTMNEALSFYHAGLTVLLGETTIEAKPYCTLTVTSVDKSVSVNLILKMIFVDLSGSGIEINPPGVIF